MIKAQEAIRAARALLGTPYSEMDCIGLIVRVIRTAPGGVPGYKTAGTNSLWRSAQSAAKCRDLTWRQEGLEGAKAGMLAFKRSGEDVHHVGLVTGEGTVIHSSSAKGCVVETPLSSREGWQLLARHRYIGVEDGDKEDESMTTLYKATVTTERDPLRVREYPETGRIIGHVPKGVTVDVLSEGGWPLIRYGELVGYASSLYLELTSVGDAQDAPGEETTPATTSLVREDGVCIVLCGRWRVAED